MEEEIKLSIYKEIFEKEKQYEKLLTNHMSDQNEKQLEKLLFHISSNDPNFQATDIPAGIDDNKVMEFGDLTYIGEVRNENFDRLKNKIFGTDDLVQLTTIEYHMRYNIGSDENPYEIQMQSGGEKTMEAKLDEAKERQYRMQLKTMEIKRNLQLNKVRLSLLLCLGLL